MVGKKIAHYEITAKLGEGGMGVVYRARDTKLGRDVALKILPEQFAQDPQRMGRFSREAHLLASLNHPNIAGIHGLEQQDGVHALAMELVDGTTLADRIDKGPIPLEEALPIAHQMADALEYAHEHGVIHRDLKPANVKVTDDGAVKLLDFGIAKAMEDEAATGDPANSPTLTLGATKAGVILGTAAYMAPEQARGKAVDKRADIWAFGVVLYEMLTGGRMFDGETISDTLAGVLKTEIDFSVLPDRTPPGVRRLLRHCLERDRKHRLQSIGDARIELEEAATAEPEQMAQQVAPTVARRLPWAVAAAVAGGLVVGLIVWALMQPQPQAVVRLTIPLAADQQFTGTARHIVAISLDGTRIVHTANQGLWLRPMDQWLSTPVSGTEDRRARSPFFSPDGEWIGFFDQTDGLLKKVSVAGGAPVRLCGSTNPYGVSWGADDMILYGQSAQGIWRVPATGGTPEQLIPVEEGERAHGPQMLPGGEWVLFTIRRSGASWDQARIVVQSIETGERIVLIEVGLDARYIPTGHLVYVLNGVLMAVPFDLGARRVTGGAVPLVEGVRYAGSSAYTGAAQFAVAANGTLVYVPGGSAGPQRLIWLNRQGAKVGEILVTEGDTRDFALSPDDQRVAYWAADRSFVWDIWVYNLARGDYTRISNTPQTENRPHWSPDGAWLAFNSSRTGNADIFTQRSDGSEEAAPLTDSPLAERPDDWSRDGNYILYEVENPETQTDIWYLERTEDGGDWEPHQFLATAAIENVPKLSPDGRYVAYASTESDQYEVYVRPFPEGGRRWTVSTDGGWQPQWCRDCNELYYVGLDNTMMAVPVSTSGEFRADTPQRLFQHVDLGVGLQYPRYDVTNDGQRFLTAEAVSEEAQQTIRVVQNWFTEFRDRQ